MVINQGDIYWIELDEPTGSEPGYSHPHVVVQNNVFNASKINTVIVCALSSVLKRQEMSFLKKVKEIFQSKAWF